MKFGVPWSVKGIRPEARETAKEAARRSGMPLGEWLNSVILQQAEEDGGRGAYGRDDEDSYGDEISGVHERLDDITRRIEQFARASAAPAQKQTRPRREQQRHESRQEPRRNEPDRDDQLAQLIARLDQRLDQFVQLPRLMAAHAPPMVPMAPMPHMPPVAHMPPAYPPMQPQMQPQMPPQARMAPQFAPLQQQPSDIRRDVGPNMGPNMGPDMWRAVAEIAARRQALSAGQKSPNPSARTPQSPANYPPQVQAYAPPQAQYAAAPAPALAPIPTQDLSGLEEHLRQITDQIETLRRPGVEDAINALRGELGDIGRALNDAMPRQAIDTIERQIQGLTHRIAESRQSSSGVDGGALSGVENALAEVRDALRGLTPAENLVGFNEAVSGLAHKIDLIVAQKNPETIGQLEHAITTLRDMAEHVASNEAVGSLAAQVQALGAKVEQMGGGAGASDALSSLEHRIGALSDALAQRSQAGAIVPPRLEALVESLSDKIEQIQQSRGDNVAAGHLEDQIVALVQRLDASDSRLGHLEAIERGLADLLVHIEEMRASKGTSGPREETSQGVIDLKHDIARTQNALDAVHGTLGLVVDRLATIERDVRSGAQSQTFAQTSAQTSARTFGRAPVDPEMMELAQPVGKIAARAVEMAPPSIEPVAVSLPPAAQLQIPSPARQAAPAGPVQRPAARARGPINPDLPPDQPLEPGSTSPRFQADPSARIAASEAALGPAFGNARPVPVAGPAGKSGFIAAARRAAQAALESATPRGKVRADVRPELRPELRSEPLDVRIEEHEDLPARRSIMKRVKSLLIAASIVAIVIGSVQIASKIFHFGGSATPQRQSAQDAAVPGNDPAVDEETTQTATANPDELNASLLSGNSIVTQGRAAPPAPTVPLIQSAPALLNPPVLGPPTSNVQPAEPTGDVTGSIPHPSSRPMREASAPAPESDRLPAALGSARLRTAALGGDANAAYEVAQRFAEGRGVPADASEAARWYERAAGKGLAPAQFRYASLLEKGQGVKKNLSQARRLYLAAATQGHAKAMHNLAVLYAEGIEGKPDYSTAATWFRKAAQHGVADSQYNLGVLCARGLGTDKNMAEAYKWFALAAAQGDREAGKKRDDVAARMDADDLTSAQQTVAHFVAQPQPHAAVTVSVPHGGWDDAAGAGDTPQRRSSTRPARTVSTNMPLTIGAGAR